MAKIIIDTETGNATPIHQSGGYPMQRSSGSSGEHFYTRTEEHRSSSARVIENAAARISESSGHSVSPGMIWGVGLVAAAWFFYHFLAKFGDGLGTSMGLVGGTILVLLGGGVALKSLRKSGKL